MRMRMRIRTGLDWCGLECMRWRLTRDGRDCNGAGRWAVDNGSGA